jgi:hypothetical protein
VNDWYVFKGPNARLGILCSVDGGADRSHDGDGRERNGQDNIAALSHAKASELPKHLIDQAMGRHRSPPSVVDPLGRVVNRRRENKVKLVAKTEQYQPNRSKT